MAANSNLAVVQTVKGAASFKLATEAMYERIPGDGTPAPAQQRRALERGRGAKRAWDRRRGTRASAHVRPDDRGASSRTTRRSRRSSAHATSRCGRATSSSRFPSGPWRTSRAPTRSQAALSIRSRSRKASGRKSGASIAIGQCFKIGAVIYVITDLTVAANGDVSAAKFAPIEAGRRLQRRTSRRPWR